MSEILSNLDNLGTEGGIGEWDDDEIEALWVRTIEMQQTIFVDIAGSEDPEGPQLWRGRDTTPRRSVARFSTTLEN